jgi:hypothetical protein
MDGLQRLTAIRDFYLGRYALKGLDEWAELNGRRYKELPEQIRRGIDRRYLSSIILLQETAKSPKEAQRLKQLVFERINSGGVQLEPQESRNAIYDGPLNQLCIRLARDPHLCATWEIPPPTDDELFRGEPPTALLKSQRYRKMEDVELVLRFFAYRQRLANQRGALKDYLDRYLREGNLFDEGVLDRLESLFKATIALVHRTFGDRAFWLRRRRKSNEKWIWYRRPTTVVFDPMMFVFSQYLDRGDEILAERSRFQSEIATFYEDNYRSFEGRYTNLSNIQDRNDLFASFVAKTLGA